MRQFAPSPLTLARRVTALLFLFTLPLVSQETSSHLGPEIPIADPIYGPAVAMSYNRDPWIRYHSSVWVSQTQLVPLAGRFLVLWNEDLFIGGKVRGGDGPFLAVLDSRGAPLQPARQFVEGNIGSASSNEFSALLVAPAWDALTFHLVSPEGEILSTRKLAATPTPDRSRSPYPLYSAWTGSAWLVAWEACRPAPEYCYPTGEDLMIATLGEDLSPLHAPVRLGVSSHVLDLVRGPDAVYLLWVEGGVPKLTVLGPYGDLRSSADLPQRYSKIAMGPDHLLLFRLVMQNRLVAQRVDFEGKAQGSEFEVASGRQQITQLDAIWTGMEYLVCWEEVVGYSQGPLSELFMLRLSSDGTPLDASPLPVAASGLKERSPSLALMEDGVLLSWGSSDGQTRVVTIRDGVVDGSTQMLVSRSARPQWFPQFHWTGTSFFTTWQSESGLHLSRVSPVGKRLEGNGRLLDEFDYVIDSSVSFTTQGSTTYVAWAASRDAGGGLVRNTIELTALDDRSNELWVEPLSVNEAYSAGVREIASATALVGDGSLLNMVWTEPYGPAQSVLVDASGQVVGGPVTIPILGARRPRPLLAWNGSVYLFVRGNSGVRMSPDGKLLDDEPFLLVSGLIVDEALTAVEDRFILIWCDRDERGTRKTLRMMVIGSDGVTIQGAPDGIILAERSEPIGALGIRRIDDTLEISWVEPWTEWGWGRAEPIGFHTVRVDSTGMVLEPPAKQFDLDGPLLTLEVTHTGSRAAFLYSRIAHGSDYGSVSTGFLRLEERPRVRGVRRP